MCNSAYLGETKKKILTRTIEHPQDSFKVKWDNSMAAQHFLTCHGQFKNRTDRTMIKKEKYGKCQKLRTQNTAKR